MQIYAHRGSSGLYPENTLAAFLDAAQLQITGIELDVHLTKDHELVVIHDEMINRTSNGQGFVKDLTVDELKTYDFGIRFSKAFQGEKIPLLAEVLEIFSETNHLINIELKTDVVRYEGIEEKVLQLVHEMGIAHRVIISSFNHQSIQIIKDLDPHIQTAALAMKGFADPFHYLHELQADALHISHRAIRNPSIQRLISQGVPVRAFTVNKPRTMLALKKMGVQAIFTDYPEKMMAYLDY